MPFFNFIRDFLNEILFKTLHNHYDDSSPDKDAINFMKQSIKTEPKNTTFWFTSKKYDLSQTFPVYEKKISDQIRNDIYCFKSPGVSPIIMNKDKESATFKVVQINETEEEIDAT